MSIKRNWLIAIFIITLSLILINQFKTQQSISEITLAPILTPQSARVVSSQQESFATYSIFHGIWQSPDSVPSLSTWYTQALQQDGWVLIVPSPNELDPQMQYLEFQKNEEFIHLSLEKSPASSETTISIDIIPSSALSEDTDQ